MQYFLIKCVAAIFIFKRKRSQLRTEESAFDGVGIKVTPNEHVLELTIIILIYGNGYSCPSAKPSRKFFSTVKNLLSCPFCRL